MRVLVEVRPEERPKMAMELTASFEEPPLEVAPLAEAGLEVDASFPAVVLPSVAAPDGADIARFALTAEPSFQPESVSALIRGEVPEGDEGEEVLRQLVRRNDVKGVFSDPNIASLTCGGDPAVGTDADVAEALHCSTLAEKGLTGEGVPVAVVDTGINLEHLTSAGHHNPFDAASSFTPQGVQTEPGHHPVQHGTMCAFDVGIAAPQATLVDHAVLLSTQEGQTVMEGLLSDAVHSFSVLRAKIESMSQEERALVISNSWGVFDPGWDFPTNHPSNYTDNPRHPFNLIVASLEAAGADVLFAAGNCGVECPDGRCKFSERPINGANSHPDVISVAGVNVEEGRIGYSSQGPGRLSKAKPDVAAYTHFKGSGVWPIDSGTSAACPVLAGVVAAMRTNCPASTLSPVQLRALLFRTAKDLNGHGFDYDNGWGVVQPVELAEKLP